MRINLTKKDLVNLVYMQLGFSKQISENLIDDFLSTIVSNIIDSYSFFFTAFYNSEDAYMAENWFEICGTQTVIKILIGFVFFLPIYGILLNFFLVKIKSKKNN